MNEHSHQPGAGPRRRTAKGERTRDALLDAALRLFAERGFHGTAVPDVARAAGVAAGTVYRHFASKEELVNVLYRRCKLALMRGLFGAVRVDDPAREQFAGFWAALAAFAGSDPRAFAFLELHHHGPYLDAESRALELRALTTIAGLVERGRAEGSLGSASVDTVMALVWGAFVGLFKASRLGYLTLDAARLAEAEALCWRAMSRPEPVHLAPEETR